MGSNIKIIVAAILTVFAVCALNSCANQSADTDSDTQTQATENITETETEGEPEMNKDSKYYQLADKAVASLIENYWSNSKNRFYDKSPKKYSNGYNYWWYAHGIDVFVDAYKRTGDEKYLGCIDGVVGDVIKRNGKIINDYYDDMEWMALALLRAYNETQNEKYYKHVQTLWNDIRRGWNDTIGGGIAWRKEQFYYKNTPANAPAAILAARIYNVSKDEEMLEWAKKIYEFTKNNLVDAKTGQVWDGKNRQNDGKIDKDWNFTYCHGVYIGAGVELYKITGEEIYLDDAKKTADYALKRFFNKKTGVMLEDDVNGGGDGGLFKGILLRYLTELYKAAPDMDGMEDIRAKILANADILAEKGTNDIGNFTMAFDKAPRDGDGRDLSVQLSGCMLFEMAAVLDK